LCRHRHPAISHQGLATRAKHARDIGRQCCIVASPATAVLPPLQIIAGWNEKSLVRVVGAEAVADS
jgi:hypothetical protein